MSNVCRIVKLLTGMTSVGKEQPYHDYHSQSVIVGVALESDGRRFPAVLFWRTRIADAEAWHYPYVIISKDGLTVKSTYLEPTVSSMAALYASLPRLPVVDNIHHSQLDNWLLSVKLPE